MLLYILKYLNNELIDKPEGVTIKKNKTKKNINIIGNNADQNNINNINKKNTTKKHVESLFSMYPPP